MKTTSALLLIAAMTVAGSVSVVAKTNAGKAHRQPASFENQPRVSEDCEAFLYAKLDKQLPKNEFVTRMRLHASGSELVDLELTLDQGNQNFCIKSGTAKVHDEKNGVCDVSNVVISSDHYDCG